MDLSTHADYLEAARVRIAAARTACAHITGSEPYGALCRWLCDDLDARHERQDELLAFLDNNLRLIVAGLRDAEPRALPSSDDRLVEPVTATYRDLPGGGGELSSALAARLRWTVEHVGPLPVLLDQLTGQPAVVRAHAVTWENVAFELYAVAEELQATLDVHTDGWHGPEAAEHRRLLEHNIEAIGGLAAVSAALGEITAAASHLVELTRSMVRGLVADLVARMTVCTVTSLPAVAAQLVAALVTWAGRVLVYAVALAAGVVSLARWLNG